jgi:hypothetical protein
MGVSGAVLRVDSGGQPHGDGKPIRVEGAGEPDLHRYLAKFAADGLLGDG